jgi:hypothetical protein
MINVQEKKDKILEYIENNGPSLPVRIAKSIEMDPIFALAIASELLSSKQIITSNIKVGDSPLYLIPGQEKQLENFTNNLKSVEKEAYHKLKEKKILIDEEQEPAIRVALRAIKDFASPFKFQEKIMWKYSFLSNEEIHELLSKEKEKTIHASPSQEIINETKKEIPEVENNQENKKQTEESEEQEVPKGWIVKKEEIKEIKNNSKNQQKTENTFSQVEIAEPEPEFLKEIKKFLEKKNIKFLKEIKVEKKEIMAKVKIESGLGDIIFTMTARDKKTINKDEMDSAVRMAKNSNTPCLLIIRKEPSKIIQKIIDENNLVKLEIMD